jgi:hypothetical protein
MIMEIGSYIGLDLRDEEEFYNGKIDIARLNSARAGIYHACRLYACNSIYVPFYLCSTVRDFLLRHSINVKPYFIDESFAPKDLIQESDHAILIVNYFGILSEEKLKKISNTFDKIIFDNSAAFYSKPINDFYNVYSPRKFFGVPDGCYVLGNNAQIYIDEYIQDISSSTSAFFFKNIEFGISASYEDRMKNEERIENAGVRRMSLLTTKLLKNIDYNDIKRKRQINFYTAHELFKPINLFNPLSFIDANSVPMCYPLVIESEDIIDNLHKMKLYVGRLWKHVLDEVPDNCFESWLSKNLIPVPIDQRYNENIIQEIFEMIISKI